MNYLLPFSIFCLLAVVLLSGVCIAEETPVDLLYMQGSSSSLSEGENGSMTLTIQDMASEGVILQDKTFLMPVENLVGEITVPVNGAILISGTDGVRTSLILISNMTYSEDSGTLTLEILPLEFYEGSALERFAGEKEDLSIGTDEKVIMTGLYLQDLWESPENYCECSCNPMCCEWCLIPGDTQGRTNPVCFSSCCDPDHSYY